VHPEALAAIGLFPHRLGLILIPARRIIIILLNHFHFHMAMSPYRPCTNRIDVYH